MSNQIAQANRQRFDLTHNATRFMDGSSYLTNEVRAYAATGDSTHEANYWNEIETLKNRDIGLAEMRKIGITAEEEAQISAMSALSNELVPLEEKSMQDVKLGRTDSAIAYVYGQEYATAINQINEIKTSFLAMLDQRTYDRLEDLTATSILLQGLTLGLVALIVLLQIVSYQICLRKIIRPIAVIQGEMEEIAQGNLSAAFEIEPDTSEIGRLAGAMLDTRNELKKYIGDITGQLSQLAHGNMDIHSEIHYIGDFLPIQQSLETIVDFLNRTLTQINEAAVQVASGADQVSCGAQALSQGATEQASAVEELAATINDISVHIAHSAGDATQANVKAQRTGKALLDSNQKMQEMVLAMESISTSSSEIGKIIKTIEDIAFQTNILALNAAVEAARAGTAGKGFAVVADEVRRLAGKSAEASKSTSELIAGSLRAVENGRSIVDRTAQALLSAVDGAREVTETLDQIAADSAHQADAVSQVTIGIEQISAVVQTNSATAEESAAASHELSDQAARMKDSVNQFTLRC